MENESNSWEILAGKKFEQRFDAKKIYSKKIKANICI